MSRAVRTGFLILALAVAGALAQAEQSKGAANSKNQKKGSPTEVKQEFGPQTVSRRGDRMSVDKPGGQGGAKGAATEHSPYHQDFGPTQPVKHRDVRKRRSNDRKGKGEAAGSK